MNPPDTTIRAATLGDAGAAEECTEAGYALPCFRCGSRVDVILEKDFARILCPSCFAQITACLGDEEDAMKHHTRLFEKWNRRADLRETMKGAKQ